MHCMDRVTVTELLHIYLSGVSMHVYTHMHNAEETLQVNGPTWQVHHVQNVLKD